MLINVFFRSLSVYARCYCCSASRRLVH